MVVFLIEGLLREFFESILRDAAMRALSYDGKSFVYKSSLGRREALDALRKDVDTTVTIWPWSRKKKFFVGHVEEDQVKIGCGKIWGPVLHGVVEKRREGGSILRGKFRLGGGATLIFGLIVASLFATVALIFFGPLHPGYICAWSSLAALIFVIGGVCVASNKGKLLGEMERQLRKSLSAEHR